MNARLLARRSTGTVVLLAVLYGAILLLARFDEHGDVVRSWGKAALVAAVIAPLSVLVVMLLVTIAAVLVWAFRPADPYDGDQQ